MTTWQELDIAHIREAGAFELCVWPLSGDGLFQAWVSIPADGDAVITTAGKNLPYIKGLPTVEEAKKAIERRFEIFLQEALDEIRPAKDEKILIALHQIAELGAHPLTRYGCKTRHDFIRHVDKMWQIALAAITEREKQ